MGVCNNSYKDINSRKSDKLGGWRCPGTFLFVRTIGAIGSHESNIIRFCIFHYRMEDIMSRRKSRHDIFNPIMKDTISYDITRVTTNSVFIPSSLSNVCVIIFLNLMFNVLKRSNKFSV
jgi:hypothetical protein